MHSFHILSLIALAASTGRYGSPRFNEWRDSQTRPNNRDDNTNRRPIGPDDVHVDASDNDSENKPFIPTDGKDYEYIEPLESSESQFTSEDFLKISNKLNPEERRDDDVFRGPDQGTTGWTRPDDVESLRTRGYYEPETKSLETIPEERSNEFGNRTRKNGDSSENGEKMEDDWAPRSLQQMFQWG